MALAVSKKFLLYIHHPSFTEEENKSALVNSLLEDYYGAKANVYTKKPKNLSVYTSKEYVAQSTKANNVYTKLCPKCKNPMFSGKCLQKHK
jgi:hypothetical protein